MADNIRECRVLLDVFLRQRCVAWLPACWPPSGRRPVRALGFARQLTVAGTDAGLLVSRRAGPWAPAGLGQVAVSAVAIAAVTDPSQLVAGGDGTRGTEALPLFDSTDGGQSWQLVQGAVRGSSMVS